MTHNSQKKIVETKFIPDDPEGVAVDVPRLHLVLAVLEHDLDVIPVVGPHDRRLEEGAAVAQIVDATVAQIVDAANLVLVLV